MKKFTLFLFGILTFTGFSQQKSTGDIALIANSNNGGGPSPVAITANFTLNNSTSKVNLVLKGPFDRWLGMGIGVGQGFAMSAGDVIIFSDNTVPKLTDRNFVGFVQPAIDASQDWTIDSNTITGTVRTLLLSRNLTTTDALDIQLPYATTNSISIACVRPATASQTVAPHGGTINVGYAANVPFSTLGVEDFSLRASSIYPNPSNGTFRIQTKTDLTKVNVYGQTGNFIKTIEVKDNSQDVEVNLKGVAKGIYLLELQNETDKSWKKIVVE